MQLQRLDRPVQRRARRGEEHLRTETVLKLPFPLDRQKASNLHACDLLCVEEDGRAAAAVASYPSGGYHDLVHSDPGFAFRSVRNARILAVDADSVLLWGKPLVEPRGLYKVTRGGTEFLHRLDDLQGVLHVGKDIFPYGRNVSDSAEHGRVVAYGQSVLVPTDAKRCITDRGMLVSNHSGLWLTERLYGLRGSEILRMLDADVSNCLTLRWQGDTVLFIERRRTWRMLWRGEEFPLCSSDAAASGEPPQVLGVWSSPDEASIAILVSYGRRAGDPPWLPPLQKLIATDGPGAENACEIATGRFSHEPYVRNGETNGLKPFRLVWSADGYGLAAIIDTVKLGFDDDCEDAPERQPIIASSSGDLIVGGANDVFCDAAVRADGSVAVHIRDDGSDYVLETDRGEIARHAFAWQPRAASNGGFTYAFVDGADICFRSTH